MCGLFSVFGPNTSYQKEISQLDELYLSRGPDDCNIFKDKNVQIIHSRLAISQNSFRQPYIDNQNQLVVAFNGELYNNEVLFKSQSEVQFICSQYLKHGLNFAEKIDGEFVVILYDKCRELIVVARDYFGTKPLFAYGDNGTIVLSSIARMLPNKTHEIFPRNTLRAYSLKNGNELVDERSVVKDLNMRKNIKRPWFRTYSKELLNRIPLDARYFVPLSSGHDSGLIAATLDKLNMKSTFYTLPRGENLDILDKRIDYLKSRGHEVKVFDLKDTYQQKINAKLNEKADYVNIVNEKFCQIDPVRDDPSPMGLATMMEYANSNDIRVCISGQGGDEIYSGGYGGFGPKINVSIQVEETINSRPEVLWPWKHVHNGKMTQYILKEEMIASIYSIESRYPFLSLDCTANYLYNYDKNYNAYYKGPIEKSLIDLNFPVDLTRLKRGFNPFSMDRSEKFLEKHKNLVISLE